MALRLLELSGCLGYVNGYFLSATMNAYGLGIKRDARKVSGHVKYFKNFPQLCFKNMHYFFIKVTCRLKIYYVTNLKNLGNFALSKYHKVHHLF